MIELEHVTFRHPNASRDALVDISLDTQPGEWIALVGANGSGKTTLARHLNGLLLPSQGSVRVDGMDTREPSAQSAIRARIGMVFQHPEDQMVASTVEEDVAFGPENLALPPAEIRRRVDAALAAVGMAEQRQRPPHQLSAGQMQRVALAGVLAMQPAYIIFDEVTAMLDPAGRGATLEQMRLLHRQGCAILHITHFMEEAALAERVLVLHQGHLALDAPPAAAFGDRARLRAWGLDQPPAARLAACIPGLPPGVLTPEALLAALPPPPPGWTLNATQLSDNSVTAPAEALVDAEGIAYTYMQGTPLAQTALRDARLRVPAGAITGLVGATGSGKSTLLQHLNALLPLQAGRLRVGPFDLADEHTNRVAVRRFAGMAFQQPEAQFFQTYAGDEIAFAPRLAGLRDDELRQAVRAAMQSVGLDFETYKDRLTFTLSGGEQRKVALASILALAPTLLLLDEPTAGLDPQARAELLAHLGELSAAGKTLLVSSHQMEDLAALCGEISVLRTGETTFSGPAGEVFRSAAFAQAGMQPPLAVLAADRLAELGWAIPPGVSRLETLCCILAGSGEAA
ncbi:MAG: ATP-binding cassette domain-containing protein [Anaerolineae bacterium]|nr:ATP-binding cassette domain-containing protein [Anaerolineae bacterium]